MAGSSCTEQLLKVSLLQCNTSAADSFYPPLNLTLPYPVSIDEFRLSAYNIAPSGSYARSGALPEGSKPPAGGKVSVARLMMSDANTKDMLVPRDTRVQLASSDESCVSVMANLLEG